MKRRMLQLAWLLAVAAGGLVAQTQATVPVPAEANAGSGDAAMWKYLAAAAAVGIACIGSGIAVGKIGAAAMGAMAEKPELSGKAMPYVGLAEGICLWGFLVAVIILFI